MQPTTSIITLTNANQLPRWFWEPGPMQTVAQAVADIQAKYPGFDPKVYQIRNKVFIEHPKNREER